MIPTLGRSNEAPAEEAPDRNQRVLVADEAAPVRKSLLEILHKLGTPTANIIEVSEAEDLLERFRAERPQIVFTEFLGVHNEDGLELIHEMLGIDPEVKIVLVTAESPDAEEVRAAVRAGIFSIVEKPVRHEKIRHALSDLESEIGGIERFR